MNRISHQFFRSLCGLFLATGALGSPPVADQADAEPPAQITVPLVYASDRLPGKELDGGFRLTRKRGPLSFGTVEVSISTRREGQSPFSDWRRWAPRESLVSGINSVPAVTPAPDIDDALNTVAPAYASREVLLYVHGYSETFKQASLGFARTIYETSFGGIPMLFSWPSAGNPLEYAGDVESQAASADNLAQVIGSLLRTPDITKLHIVAHSLGNQTLIQALRQLQNADELNIDLGEIVLFSPDYDQSDFVDNALPVLQQTDSRVSLYVASRDIPLLLSRVVNQGKRLGDASGEVFTTNAIETIDVSPVATLLESHITYKTDPFVQADLHYLLVQRLGAADRPTLREVRADGSVHWEADPAFSPE